jgi:type IV secretory pathway VirB9-like protein
MSCLGISCVSGSAAEVNVLAGDPNTVSRTVTYHETDIIPIATEIRFTTLIELPREESIVEVTCGDKEYWPVNWTGNLAYVKPAKPSGRTNINLITASGNVYSFLATEVSQNANGHADLKVFVAPSDGSAIVAMKGSPRYIPADSVAQYKKQAEEAQAKLAAEQNSVRQELAKERDALRIHAPRSTLDMGPRTEQMIRADIALRWSPLVILLLVFFSTVAGLGALGLLLFLAGVLR